MTQINLKGDHFGALPRMTDFFFLLWGDANTLQFPVSMMNGVRHPKNCSAPIKPSGGIQLRSL